MKRLFASVFGATFMMILASCGPLEDLGDTLQGKKEAEFNAAFLLLALAPLAPIRTGNCGLTLGGNAYPYNVTAVNISTTVQDAPLTNVSNYYPTAYYSGAVLAPGLQTGDVITISNLELTCSYFLLTDAVCPLEVSAIANPATQYTVALSGTQIIISITASGDYGFIVSCAPGDAALVVPTIVLN